MITALESKPKFSQLFMAYLLARNSRIEEDLIDQLFNSSEKRLARLLLLLANFGKEASPQPIGVNISQETLAEMIGATRSRVSFFMNKFRKLGFISYNGKIAGGTSPGLECERLIRRARQAETASHINEWLSSPGLRTPN
jgi:CRP/FNR family transcriptional regulator, cyclic AMP receptor protein